jgi:cyclic pyranopterin phosphate synthase
LKTCLYDNGVLDVKKLLRSGMGDEDLKLTLYTAFNTRPVNGFEAEQKRKGHQTVHESMSTIGG